MEKKQTAKYIVCDTLSAMLAWAALFAFRKMMVGVEWSALVSQVLTDNNFWIGVVAVPAGWLVLYTIQGMYRNVLRRARLKELIETLIATVIGVLVIFFVLMMDDEVVTYRNHYASFLFLLGVHFVLTYVPRMLITSQTVRRVHSRQIGFPTLMIGNGRKALQTYLDLENQETYSGEQFVGCIALNQEHSELEKIMPCVGTMEGLREVVEQYHVEDNEREKVSEIPSAESAPPRMTLRSLPFSMAMIWMKSSGMTIGATRSRIVVTTIA